MRRDEATRTEDAIQGSPEFGAKIAVVDGGLMVLRLIGEVDLISMPAFDHALDVLISLKPHQILFDLRGADFISVAGYAAIGRCSLTVDQLRVCANGCLAEKVLGLLGYDNIIFVSTDTSASLSSLETSAARLFPSREAPALHPGLAPQNAGIHRRGTGCREHGGKLSPHFEVASR
jgi:anti-anti-sigma regulatory factor